MTIDRAQHKAVLVHILKDVFSDRTLAPYLGFKGGTAAMLFYGLPRFSVDLDFDLLDAAQEEVVFEHISALLSHYGTVKAQRKRYSLFFLLSYKDKMPGAHNIKVEINKRTFGSRYEIKQYLGIPLRVMVLEDMVAHKLVALYERMGSTNRDIFDVWFFLRNQSPINKAIVERRTQLNYQAFLQTCIAELEKLSNRDILSGMGELLDAAQRAWVKAHLKKDTLFLLALVLQQQS